MKADSYRFDGSGKCRLDKLATNSKADGVDKEKILAKTAENLQKMAALQDAFYADGREGLIFILQAMDAAGKDSTIKHVMSGLNPQGVQVTSFKQPNSEELKHDFLWRVNKELPARGYIAILLRGCAGGPAARPAKRLPDGPACAGAGQGRVFRPALPPDPPLRAVSL